MTDPVAPPEEHQDYKSVGSFDDPHMQPLARNVKRAESIVGLLLLLGFAGFVAYGALYWVGGNPAWEGIFGGIGLFSFGFGLSAWGKYLLPKGPFVEQRHPMASAEPERDAITSAVVERGSMVFRRRKFLGGILAVGSGVMGVVFAFPLVRSLGSVPGTSFDHTKWKARTRLVDFNGKPITVETLEDGGSITVFPEGFVGDAMAQTILVRQGYQDITTAAGREGWAPAGNLAFSKVCTHAGCPVGLYQELTHQLLCPCHQSLFDVGPSLPAKPVFGPAPRPLPQLPIYVDDQGYLRAQSDYHEPVGPGFWERS